MFTSTFSFHGFSVKGDFTVLYQDKVCFGSEAGCLPASVVVVVTVTACVAFGGCTSNAPSLRGTQYLPHPQRQSPVSNDPNLSPIELQLYRNRTDPRTQTQPLQLYSTQLGIPFVGGGFGRTHSLVPTSAPQLYVQLCYLFSQTARVPFAKYSLIRSHCLFAKYSLIRFHCLFAKALIDTFTLHSTRCHNSVHKTQAAAQ